MYLSDALDLIGAMLLDERRERAVQVRLFPPSLPPSLFCDAMRLYSYPLTHSPLPPFLPPYSQLNVPLTLLLLRDEQMRLLPRLLEAAGLLLDQVRREGGREVWLGAGMFLSLILVYYIFTSLPSLPPSLPFSQILSRAEQLDIRPPSFLPPGLHQTHFLPLLRPLLVLLHRLSSRQLVLDSPYVPLPPAVPPSLPPDPRDSNELSLRLHVLVGKHLLSMWQAQSGRIGRLPP